jgi:hypothetical protein
MAFQNVTRRQLAGLLAGAAAAESIAVAHGVENLPKDEIQQWEISCLYHLESTKDLLLLAFKRRIEAGATIEAGPYALEPDPTTAEEMEKHMGPHDFNAPGFHGVSFNDPADAEEEAQQ